MKICLFHKYELVSILYEEYSPRLDNYGIRIFEVIECSKCGKIKYKINAEYENTYSVIHNNLIMRLEKYGVTNIYGFKIGRLRSRCNIVKK